MTVLRRTLLVCAGLATAAAACTDFREPVTPATPPVPGLRASLAGGGSAVVYSNFGPGMAFDANLLDGWTINGNLGPGIGEQGVAEQFTPTGDFTFTGAQVPLVLIRGTGGVHVILQADAAGLPGAVIEDIPLAGMATTPTILAAASTLNPVLHHGTPYWLTLIAGSDGLVAGWNWNSIGDVSAVTFAGTQGGSAAGPWATGFSATRAAFEIDGAPAASPVIFVAAPDLDAAVPSSTVIEGTAIKLGFFNVPAAFQFAFDCGAGAGYGAFTTNTRTACPTVDNGQRSVRGKTLDSQGKMTEYATVVTVVNHAPHVVLSTAQRSPAPVGAAVAVSGTFSDPGVLDAPWSWVILWGDGSAISGSTGSQGAPIVASHAYAAPGSFTIKMTVQDKDGGVGKSNSVSVSVVAAAGNFWTSEGPLPTPRGKLAAAVVAGSIYAVAGSGAPVLLGTVEAYDPVANVWTAKAPQPTQRYALGAGVVNGIVYAIGGYGCCGPVGTVEAYDPATNSWTTRSAMPTPRYGLAVAVVNGVIYAIGGAGANGGIVNTVEAYDPLTNTWVTRAPLPTARGGLGVSAINGVIFAVGGYGPNGMTGVVEAYDPAANTWTTRASLPTPRYDVAAGAVNGMLYAVGGFGQNGVLGTVESYDPVANVWVTRASLPTPRQALGVATLSGLLYAIGGFNGTAVGAVEAYHP